MKTRSLMLLLMAHLAALPVISQDVIFKKDGSKEEVKVILVNDKEIQFRKFNNPEGPVYTVPKSEIVVVNYENGTVEVMSYAQKPSPTDLNLDFARNVLSYHLFDLVFMDFTISYERILNSGKLGLRIPVSFGYDFDDWNFNHIFYSGAGINFYPTGQGKWRYFMGPQLQMGIGQEEDWTVYYDNEGNFWYEEYTENEGFFMRFLVDNGVMFMPVKNFSISAIGSIGIRYFPEAPYEDDVMRTDGHFAINLG